MTFDGEVSSLGVQRTGRNLSGRKDNDKACMSEFEQYS